MARHFKALLAEGRNWDECESQMAKTGYTGYTYEVRVVGGDSDGSTVTYGCKLFSSLEAARDEVMSIVPSEHGFDDTYEVEIDDDAWDDGKLVVRGWGTCWTYRMVDGKWEVCF